MSGRVIFAACWGWDTPKQAFAKIATPRLNQQLLIVTPLQKIHIIESFASSVGFVHNEEGKASKLRNLSIEEYRAEKAKMAG
jgi:uncharacterized protein YPO0396